MKTALTIAIVIVGLVIVVSILMQPSKSDALSGLIQGSNNETFFSKNKARTKEGKLKRLTIILGITFAVLTIVLGILMML